MGLVSVLVILLFVFWWTITLSSRLLTESHVYHLLELQADRIHRLLPEHLHSARSGFEQLLEDYPDRHYLLTLDGRSVSVGNLVNIAVVDMPAPVPGQRMRQRGQGRNGESILASYSGAAINGESMVLGVLQDVTPINNKLAVFQWFSAILAIVLLSVMLAVQHLILRRSIEKLEGIRRDMLRLEHGQAVALTEDVPSEIMPLVVEFNQLLRRFEQRLRQSRNALGNLAHSLKGPLNLLLRSADSEVIEEEQRRAISQNASAIAQLIESELKRARLAGRGAVGFRFDVDAELPAMIGLLEQIYSEKKVQVHYRVEKDVQLVHDRQDMLELIGNLLDNAVKWCDNTVELTVRGADGVIIDVEDDGPGCSPEALDQLTGRGVRLDESVAGHGLGLSIVKDIVESYNGRLVLETSDLLGGLKASAYLPKRQ